MWGYYGSKANLVDKYPQPEYNTVIEPFAGTAQYSLKYWNRNIILIEKYEVIVNLWKWLQQCSEKDILETRRLDYGESVDDFSWDCQERKNLVGFIITGGSAIPKKRPSKWKTVVRPNTQKYRLETIASNLYKIRHWNIKSGEYTESPNIEATWFIDPPYQCGGEYYKYSNREIDYNFLSEWCRNRKGQAIVCEKQGADWLSFKHLSGTRGNRYNYNEVLWKNSESYLEKL